MPISKASLILSVMFHMGLFGALAVLDTLPPAAPVLSGGGGGGGLGRVFHVEIGLARAALPEPVLDPVPDPPVPRESTLWDQSPACADEDVWDSALPPSPSVPVLSPAPVPVPPAPPAPESFVPPSAPPPQPPSPPVLAALASPSPRQDAGGPANGASCDPGVAGPAAEDPGALKPDYPVRCRRLGHEGTAVVRVRIGTDGSPLDPQVIRSAGCPDLDLAAIAALRKARFHPARQWGRAVEAVIDQPFRFVLRK